MSGTYQNALNAVEKTPLNVQVVDTRGPTMSNGWQVLAAARCREQGGGLAEMVEQTAVVRKTLTQIVGRIRSNTCSEEGGLVGRQNGSARCCRSDRSYGLITSPVR